MADLYRKNVGIVVCRKGKVLMCARADQKDLQWQFPQGGIEKGEDVIAAAKRELAEETGITSVHLLQKMPQPLRYDFPKGNRVHSFASYKGQEQTWVLFAFTGSDDEIDFLTNPQEIEFKAFEWVDIFEAPQRIIAFKKPVYLRVADYFAPYVKENADE